MSFPSSSADFCRAMSSIDSSTFEDEVSRKEALAAARALCHRLERPMDTMLRVAWIEPSFAASLKIGMDMGLFKALSEDGPCGKHTVDNLASATKSDPVFLRRLLRLLASMDAITELEEDLFAPTELSNAMLIPSINSAIEFKVQINDPAYQHLPCFLKETGYRNPTNDTDGPWQFALRTKLSHFAWQSERPAVAEMFGNHMSGYTSQRGTWHDVYPIEDRLLDSSNEVNPADIILVDIAGSQGADLIRFATSYMPNVKEQRLVLQDLPGIIESVDRSQSLPETIKTVSMDFFKQGPVSGARAYFMHSVLHDWADPEAVQILERMRPILKQNTPDGRKPKLLLNENVLPNKGAKMQPAALDLMMAALNSSFERSEDQWRKLLDTAGYRINEIFMRTGVDEAIIEAEVE